MATLTFFLRDVAVNGFGSLSLVDPGASTMNTGWVPGKTAISNFSALLYGTERASGTFSTTDYLVTTHPNPGSGDSWRSETAIKGVFANANWTLTFRVRAITSASTQLGRVKVRVWKSSSPTGASPTELTSATQTGTTTGAITTSADATSTVTWAPGGTLTFNGEYLFVQCEWEITTVGGTNTADVDFRASASTVLTSDFTPGLPIGLRDAQLPTPPPAGIWRNFRTYTSVWNPNLFAPPPSLPPGESSYQLTTTWSEGNWTSLRTFLEPWNPNILGGIPPDTTNIPARVLEWGLPPPIWHYPPERTWTWAYNINLIGKDQLPVGEISAPSPALRDYPSNLRSWLSTTTALSLTRPFSQKDWPLPRGPDFSNQLRTWFGGVPPVVSAPFIQSDWPLPRGPDFSVQLRTWTSGLPPPTPVVTTLPIGEAILALPAGQDFPLSLRSWLISPSVPPTPVDTTNLPARVLDFGSPPGPPLPLNWTFPSTINLLTVVVVQPPFAQDDWPLPRAPQQPALSWTFAFNKNLIGQDQLPVGKDTFNLPPQPPLLAIQLRTWINTTALTLATIGTPFAQYSWPLTSAAVRPTNLSTWIDQAKLLLATPFNQEDWPNPKPQPPAALSWTSWFNLNLVGQDKLPSGEIVTDLPPRAPQQPIPIFTATFNKNLIGQDQLPNGMDTTALPPRDYDRSIQLRTWIQNVNLALTTQAAVLPFNQYDWPVPKGPQQPTTILASGYNPNLISQDKLPFRQSDWPNPTQPFRSPTLASWIDRAKAYLQPPKRQTDWPLPRPLTQPDRSFASAFPKTLIGKDKLPFRQQDWPLPRDVRQPEHHRAREFASGLNIPLKFPPFTGLLPRNQYNWPNPQQPAEMRSRYNFIYGTQNFYPIYVSPIPPPPDPSPPEDVRLIYNAGNEWQMLDRIREPGPVGWR